LWLAKTSFVLGRKIIAVVESFWLVKWLIIGFTPESGLIEKHVIQFNLKFVIAQ